MKKYILRRVRQALEQLQFEMISLEIGGLNPSSSGSRTVVLPFSSYEYLVSTQATP